MGWWRSGDIMPLCQGHPGRECPCPGDVRVPRGQPRDITITRKSSLGISLSLETPLEIISVFLDSSLHGWLF